MHLKGNTDKIREMLDIICFGEGLLKGDIKTRKHKVYSMCICMWTDTYIIALFPLPIFRTI